MKPLELVSLELDKPAERIGEYFEKELGMPIRRVQFPKKDKNYYEKKEVCDIVDKALGQGDERKLVVYGYGLYHHFTYGLCRHADRFSEDYAYVHFDHHHDSCKNEDNLLSCGSFVVDILEDTNASAVLYVGSDNANFPDSYIKVPDAFPHQCFTEEDLRIEGGFFKEGGFEKLESGLRSLPQQVYLTFDLDVMPASLICTSYSRGTLNLQELMRCIALIKQSKQIIGADVLGYTGKSDKDLGKEVYAEIVDSLL